MTASRNDAGSGAATNRWRTRGDELPDGRGIVSTTDTDANVGNGWPNRRDAGSAHETDGPHRRHWSADAPRRACFTSPTPSTPLAPKAMSARRFSDRHLRRRRTSLVLLPLLMLAWEHTAAAQSPKHPRSSNGQLRDDGWRYTVEIRGQTTAPGGPTVIDSVVTGTALIRGRNARLDIVGSWSPEFPMGGWVLSDDGGRLLLVVDPVARTFRALPSASSIRELNSSKFISFAVSRLVVRGDTLGECGMIAGHAVSCYRLTREYLLTQRYFLIRRSATIREVITFWVASDLPNMDNPVARFFTEGSPFAFDRLDNVRRARRVEDNLFSGVPLRMELKTTQAEVVRGTSRTVTNINSVELRSIERARVDPSRFDIPANYRLQKE
ncbi:MAG: hypothetical protein HEQ38_03925 [Gemmatimonas sp.]|jgi:hypothetical protein|nr:hypothetical protein [Gemmatimonas sp.]